MDTVCRIEVSKMKQKSFTNGTLRQKGLLEEKKQLAFECEYLIIGNIAINVILASSFFEAADIACIIPQPAQPALILPTPPKKVFTATTAAPDGWLEALPNALKYLENFNIERHNHG